MAVLNFERVRTIGGIDIELPKPPQKKDIANYNLPQKDQKFYPPDSSIIDEINSELRREVPEPTKEQIDFVKEEWRRRREGYWFFNNGNVEYITGLHYMYLAYWKIPVKKEVTLPDGRSVKRKSVDLPNFVDSDRDYFYFWGECYADPLCVGMIHVTNRRDGKTFRSTVTAYELISRTKDVFAAIQSKTSSDAKKVFLKLVRSWQKMPEFFKPADVGDSFPQTELMFDEPKKRDTKSHTKEYREVLRSKVYHINSKEEALDGEDLIFCIQDEIGKTKPKDADVAERIAIVRECVSDGADVTGKILCTTTVEEMEKKGGKECKRVWDESDPSKRDAVGQTSSGLYRYFKPANYGFRGDDPDEDGNIVSFVDEYGYSDKDRARKYIMKVREGKSGASLVAYIRKYPLNEQEAFYMDAGTEVFPSQNIYTQLNYNEGLVPGTIRRGNLIWVGEDKREVKFMLDPDGRWVIAWELPEDQRCAYTMGKNGMIPMHHKITGAGTDPFDHRTTVDNKKSNAASYVFKGFDLMNRHLSNRFVCEYIARPDVPEMFYDDMVKQSVYYSNKMLIENNKPGLINYMRVNGFKNYIATTYQSDYTKTNTRTVVEGIALSGPAAREALVNGLLEYVYHHVGVIHEDAQEKMGFTPVTPNLAGYCYFDHLLTDWLNFDINKWTDYDATVASGLALLSVTPVKKNIKKTSRVDVSELFNIYKI
jgi:hypothetical protein